MDVVADTPPSLPAPSYSILHVRTLTRIGRQKEAAELRLRRQQLDEQRALMGHASLTEKEEALMREHSRKEAEFNVRQARARAEIRVRSGRAKPIDIIALCLDIRPPSRHGDMKSDLAAAGDAGPDGARSTPQEEEDPEDGLDVEVAIDDPAEVFQGLTLEELDELTSEIQFFHEIDTEQFPAFWSVRWPCHPGARSFLCFVFFFPSCSPCCGC